MCHVEESAGGIALDPHVARLSQPSQRAQGTGPRDLCLVVLVRCQVGDTADSIALDLDIVGHHLSDQRLESAKMHYQYLIVG